MSEELQTCPKDNVAAERVFAGLDYLKRKSPQYFSTRYARDPALDAKQNHGIPG